MTLDYEPISQWSADGERGIADIAEVLNVPTTSQLREQELRELRKFLMLSIEVMDLYNESAGSEHELEEISSAYFLKQREWAASLDALRAAAPQQEEGRNHDDAARA